MKNKTKMPFIQFSVNTQYLAAGSNIPEGMGVDGTFRLRHHFSHLPPPETEFTLKHISIDASGYARRTESGGGGADNSSNKKPTAWVSVDFPQLTERIISSQLNTVTATEENSGAKFTNNRGILRFPITTYPVTGEDDGDSNAANRFEGAARVIGRKYEHKGTHNPHIKLGTFNLEEAYIDCILTPRDVDGRTAGESDGADRTCRISRIQVILEYK